MKISPPLAILCAYRGAVFFAAVSVTDVSVDAADVVAGKSDTSTSRHIKPTSFLSKFQVDLESSIRRGDETSRPDELKKKLLNVASAVTVTHNFLSNDETALFRLNENKYQRKRTAVFSGNRMWGGAYLPRSFLHKLVDVGGQQCASEDYENTLPAGVHILTNHVTETTDPHVDYNPITLERIENDVAVVFLNSNPDATFYVEDEGYPIEEGMLITFPGGSVPHHIEMEKEKEDGGFVHMLGPFEIGGSHGTVGQVVQNGRNLFLYAFALTPSDNDVHSMASTKIYRRRMLEVDGSEENNTITSLTTQQYGAITGEITVTGWRDGIDLNGVTNHTLSVVYRLEGLSGLNCSAVDCFISADIIKNQPNFCEGGNIGQIMNEEPSDSSDNSITGDAAGSYTFLDLEELDISGAIEGQMFINIGKPVTDFFDAPMALYGHDETMLACSVFTEVKAVAEDEDEEGAMSMSSASSYRVALWAMTVFLSSAVALITTL